jgi:DNA-binding NarL/FixJ family response regulator
MKEKPRFVTVKQIADKLEVSDQTIYNHMRRGMRLARARDRICRSRLFTEKAEQILRENGHEVVF